MFDEIDRADLSLRGITPEQIDEQLLIFRNGQSFPTIIAPATPKKGIFIPDVKEQDYLQEKYEKTFVSTIKFVPASGAATRMFKELHELSVSNAPDKYEIGVAPIFFGNLPKFAFWNDIEESDSSTLSKGEMLSFILNPQGLGYSGLPKGLVKFHKYGRYSRSAFEEHLIEGGFYLKSNDKKLKFHFTISQDYLHDFYKVFLNTKPLLEKRFGYEFDVSFSFQDKSTDTIAVDENLNPFRLQSGSLLFRPGGHGALLSNLAKLDEELIFIKNIDNVVKESLLGPNIRWKKILAGKLLELRERVFSYISALDGEVNKELIQETKDFLANEFCVEIPTISDEILADFLRAKLDRPIRVCGMVRNSGEPGGGPFIVKDYDGSTSLQILESAQINPEVPEYGNLFRSGTHFNPVDIVCSIRRFDGSKFDLSRFTDPETAFISEKSHEGRRLFALELPGLWNGSMSNWNTFFVEVPSYTFTPVKTVFDLLRVEHQE